MRAHSGEFVDCTAEAYYADRILEGVTLNQSTAKLLINESPMHAYEFHPRLGGRKSEGSSATELGTVIHALLLENGRGIKEIFANNWLTNKAKEERDAARSSGLTPILTVALQQARKAAQWYRDQLDAQGIELTGESEATLTWQEELAPAKSVACRARLDKLQVRNNGTSAFILDIKTTSKSVHPDNCARLIWDRRYDIQAVAYTRAVEATLPAATGRVGFGFLFVEVNPPYAVAPVYLSGGFLSKGLESWTRAVELWYNCSNLNRYSGFGDSGFIRVEPPAWAMNKEGF